MFVEVLRGCGVVLFPFKEELEVRDGSGRGPGGSQNEAKRDKHTKKPKGSWVVVVLGVQNRSKSRPKTGPTIDPIFDLFFDRFWSLEWIKNVPKIDQASILNPTAL